MKIPAIEKVTLVLGASQNPERYSYKAIKILQEYKYPVIALGRRESDLKVIKILSGMPEIPDKVHTVTMYLGAANQKEYYNYILSLHPSRLIFNPGTRNPEFEELAIKEGIEVVCDCMFVMLETGIF